MAEYKLFPGCVIPNRLPFLELAARKLFEKLDVETSDGEFNCCPEPIGIQSADKLSWLALAARNLALAEAENKDICSLCNGCTQTLKAAQHELHNASLLKKEEINHILSKVGKEFKNSIKVKHFVQVLIEDAGLEKIKNLITKKINLKVAAHTGCHYMRPAHVMEWDDPENPIYLRQLISVTGAIPVDYKEEVLCCGNGASNSSDDYGLNVLKRKMDSLIDAGAEAIIVICPACFTQFDTKQRGLTSKFEKEYKIPVIYLTELLSLAMGMTPDELNMKFHTVKVKDLLSRIGL